MAIRANIRGMHLLLAEDNDLNAEIAQMLMELAYAKDNNAVSADFHLGSLQNRKTLQGKEDAPQRGGLPEAKRRVSTTQAEVASDERRVFRAEP